MEIDELIKLANETVIDEAAISRLKVSLRDAEAQFEQEERNRRVTVEWLNRAFSEL